MTFDATTDSGYQVAQFTYGWTHTCGALNRYLLVAVSLLSNLGTAVTGITYDGAALTKLGHRSAAVALRVELWGLENPAVGAHTVEVTFDGVLNSTAGALSFGAVSQAAPTGTFVSATAVNVGAADATVDATVAVNGGWVAAVVATTDAAITAGAGLTPRWNLTGVSGSGAGGTSGPRPPGTVTTSWTDVGAGVTWVIAAVPITPAVADPIARLMGQVCV